MKNYQDKFGNEGYGAYGQGNFIQTLPQPQRVTYGDFSGGLNTKDSREDIQPSSSPNSLDVEVTLRDRLRPVPGTTAVETLVRSAAQLVLHASLDYTSELVLFDAPFMGVKTGDITTWTDVGLPQADRRFASVNFGGTLLFSNGRVGLYSKEAGKSEVTLVEGGPAAHTFASFAGRVFAGASIIGGNREPLGISWSGASSEPDEWEPFDSEGVSTGAGFELLIDDMAQGNYLVALRTMGLDFLAILLRNSIWIGRRTSQRARPADFQPRVTGVGAVNEASCVVTRFGVVHLHDSGMYLFDGNTSTLISEQINSELLPLDRSQLRLYSSSYNPTTKQVYLFTPTCSWVYDLERQRWHKRSLIARGASIFASQIAAVAWAELTGTWADQDQMWEEYKAQETGTPAYVFLGPTGGLLAKEDTDSSANFGTPMEPYWEFPLIQGTTLNQLMTTKKILIDYEGEGIVDLFLPDNDSEFVFWRTTTLPAASTPRLKPTFCEFTGKGVGLRIVFVSGKPEILHTQVEFLLRGPRIEYVALPTYNLVESVPGLLLRDSFERENGAVGNNWFVPPGPAAGFGTWSIVDNSAFCAYTAGSDPSAAMLVHPDINGETELFIQVEALLSTAGVMSAGILGRGQLWADRFALSNTLLHYYGLSWSGLTADFYSSGVYDYYDYDEDELDTPARDTFRTLQAFVSNTVQRTALLGLTDNQLLIDITPVVANYAGIYHAMSGSRAAGRYSRFRHFAACKNHQFIVNGVPAGMKLRVGDVIVTETGGTCSFDLWAVPVPLLTVDYLDAEDQVIASITGEFWPGGSYNLVIT